jgi:hypothetical protein
VDPDNLHHLLELAGVRCTGAGDCADPVGEAARDAAQAQGITLECLDTLAAGISTIQSVTRQLAAKTDAVRLLDEEIRTLCELASWASLVPGPDAPGVPLVLVVPIDTPRDHERNEIPEPAQLPAMWQYPPTPSSPGLPGSRLLARAADSVLAIGRGWQKVRADHCPNCGTAWVQTVSRGRPSPKCPGCRPKDLRPQSRSLNWHGQEPFVYWDNHFVFLDPDQPVRLRGYREIEASGSGFRTHDNPPATLVELRRVPRRSL